MKLGTRLLQQKAKEVRSKSRKELVGSIAVGIFVAGTSAYGIFWTGALAAKLVFAAAVAWALAGQYFLHRGMWTEPLPADIGLATGLDFCRREVAGRLRLHGNVLRWLLGPFMLAVAAFVGTVARKGSIEKMAPFLILLAVWAISMVFVRARQERELRREIEELDQIDQESREPQA